MKKKWLQVGLLAVVGMPVQFAVAQDSEDELIEEIVTTGTRSVK